MVLADQHVEIKARLRGLRLVDHFEASVLHSFLLVLDYGLPSEIDSVPRPIDLILFQCLSSDVALGARAFPDRHGNSVMMHLARQVKGHGVRI